MRAIFNTLLGRLYFLGKQSAKREIKAAAKAGEIDIEDKIEHGIGSELGFPEVDAGDFLDKTFLRDWLKTMGATLTAADARAVKQFNDFGFFVTGEFDDSVLKQARDVIFTQVNRLPAREIAKQVKEQVKNWGHGHIGTIVRTNGARAFNDGRMAQFKEIEDEIQGFQYSAIIDQGTTQYCFEHHGQMISQDNKLFGEAQIPNHFQCRSMMLPIFSGEEFADNWNQGVSVPHPMPGFGA